MANIIGDLYPLKWRGLDAPCESASYAGGHSQAKRLYPYIDAAGHDGTGRLPYEFQPTRLHFLNTIKPFDWYPTRWSEFRAALEDKSAGDLDHPDLGSVRAVVLTWNVTITAQNRGGIVVDVVWEEDIDDLDARVVYLGPEVAPEAVAAAVDEGMAELGIAYPDGSSDNSFSDAINSIKGFAFSLQLTVDGAINQVIGTVNEVLSLVDTVEDHAKWALHDNLVALWKGLRAMQKQAIAAARPTGIYVTVGEETLDAIARLVGNTVAEMIELNLALINRPTVPRGTAVRYYLGKPGKDSPNRVPGP